MKKIYSLAAAAALTASAFAAAPVQQNVAKVKENLPVNIEQVSVNVKDLTKAPAKAVASRDQLLGIYNMTYTWPFQSADRWDGSVICSFEAGSTANEIVIRNMPYSDVDCIAYFDAAAQTVTINQQFAFLNGGVEEYWLMMGEDPNGGSNLVSANKIVGHIDAAGNIDFGPNSILLLGDDEGYYAGFRAQFFTRLYEYAPDFSQLTSIGDAEFTDDFLKYLYKEEYQPSTSALVPAYRNADKTQIVLVNPYMYGEWTQLNMQTELGKGPGYIVFDISDPEVVLVNTMTDSGLWLSDEDGEVSFYPFNEEAIKVQMQGFATIDVYDEFDAVDKPLSYFDEDARTIQTYNGWFGQTGEPLMRYGFAEEKNPDGSVKVWKQLSYTVVLPEGWNEGGEGNVNALGADKGAKRFFNLQGMEISNPAQGELVIVKQGNKSSKVIF